MTLEMYSEKIMQAAKKIHESAGAADLATALDRACHIESLRIQAHLNGCLDEQGQANA